MKLTPERITQLQDAADRRVKEGWQWMEVSPGNYLLMPPVGSPQSKWAATWLQISPSRSVPEWIERQP